uniref:Exostosin GT47 domain-containing protein n=1 Tax=Chrysotila carterae TaxID=13221 RepID=A0A7S4B586_CHRCT
MRSAVTMAPASQVETPVDSFEYTRRASLCMVPEGKIGSYGHRTIMAIMQGCVPVVTKELHSHQFFDEVINWSKLQLRVPPSEVPHLPSRLRGVDVEELRRAGQRMRRRLLWASIYGSCQLRGEGAQAEGGSADAFETLMEVLRTPRRHFVRGAEHEAERAPEMLADLYPWLRARGGEACTRAYQCFDKYRRSCG